MAEVTPTSEDVALDFAVVIPCHNVEDTLAAQLDALVTQTWELPWGILVVDNNSTDGTRQVAEGYRHRGVRVVTANDGRGVSYARNAGVRATRARAIAFCDGDDVVQPGWVSSMARGLSVAPLVSGRVETSLLNPEWLANSRPMPQRGHLPTFGTIGFASGCSSGVRRDLFESLGGYDEGFVGLEDIEFSLRALARGVTIRYLPDAVVAYRLRDDLRSVWRQGLYYGRGRPELKRRARDLGLPVPSTLETWKSWAWLLLHLHELGGRSGRYRWSWVLANRLGVILGNFGSVPKLLGRWIPSLGRIKSKWNVG